MKNNDLKSACLSVRDLTTSFLLEGKKRLVAVDHVSFDLYSGESLGIVGESGSGKSMMIKSILKLVPKPGKIEEGQILLNGQDLMTYSDKQMRKYVRGTQISMIFQEPMTALNPSYTIGAQIEEVYKLHTGLSKQERHQKIINLLEKVRIPDPEKRMKDYPHQFSGGMRQRVLIALALACNPAVLFADEPTTALDVTVQADIMDLLQDMKQSDGLSIILISHNLNLVTERSDRVIVFYSGSIMEMGASSDIAREPLHPYTIGLMNSLPDIQKKGWKLTAIPGDLPDLANRPCGCVFYPRCSRAMDVCRTCRPDLKEIKPGHVCRCHLYNEEPAKEVKGLE